MSDEQLEELCKIALERIMYDEKYFLHLMIKATEIRAERICKQLK